MRSIRLGEATKQSRLGYLQPSSGFVLKAYAKQSVPVLMRLSLDCFGASPRRMLRIRLTSQ